MADPDPNTLGRIADELLARFRRGEHPSPSEYALMYPELADEIRELFPALQMMEDLKPAASEATGEFLATGGATLERLGDFRILREIGRGGMGIVFEAEQESLGRRVALKVLPAQALLDAGQRKRFLREARAAARLHHTNIVPVFGVGEHEGMLYYVMQLIQGLALDEVLAELRRLRPPKPSAVEVRGSAALGHAPLTPGAGRAGSVAQALVTGQFGRREERPAGLSEPAPGASARDNGSRVPDTVAEVAASVQPSWGGSGPLTSSSVVLPGQSGQSSLGDSGRHYWQSVARIGIQVADALHYAHTQGILHRDIKPSNLLLDTHGGVWVTDFGLAKAATEGDNLTHTGDIVGTLRYMAPERFQGTSDARSDVYSLGLTLYEMLVQRPAFGGSDRNQLIHEVTHGEPRPPRALNRAIPLDLETIVLKAIDREPGRRYPTAGALGDDLRRFLEDKPIRARRVSVRERFWRWCRRNPLTAGLVAGIAALLVLAAVGSSVAAFHFRILADQERQARQKADEEREQAELARQHEAEQRQRAALANQGRLAAEKARADAEAAGRREAELRQQAEKGRRESEQRERQKAQAAQAEAEDSLRQARQAVNDYLTRVSESRLLREPGLQPLRKELLESALSYYQGFLRKRGQDAALLKDLADAYVRVGRITAEVGSRKEAIRDYRQALKLLTRIEPRTPEVLLALAEGHQAVGNLQRQEGQLEAATRSLQQAYRTLLLVSPQDSRRRVTLTSLTRINITGVMAHVSSDPEILARFFGLLNDLGTAQEEAGELTPASWRYYEALYIQRRLVEEGRREGKSVLVRQEALTAADSADGRGCRFKVYPLALQGGRPHTFSLQSPGKDFQPLLRIEDETGQTLAEGENGPGGGGSHLTFTPEAGGTYRAVVTTALPRATGAFDLRVLENTAALADRMHRLAGQWTRLGRLKRSVGLYEEAQACNEEAQHILEALLQDFPQDSRSADFERDLAGTFEDTGDLLAETGKLAEALTAQQRALPTRRRLAAANPAVTDYQADLARTYFKLAAVQERRGQGGAALESLQAAIDAQGRLVRQAGQSKDHARMLSRQLARLGRVHRERGEAEDAAQAYRRARRLLRKLPPSSAADYFELAVIQAQLSAVPSAKGVPGAAKEEADLAMEALRQAVARGFKDLQRLSQEADLEPVRKREDYQALLAQLQRNSKVPHWLDDFEAAKAQAARENKDLFLWFGGSDWATIDVFFRKTFLTREAFFDYAGKHFVLVDLDTPKHRPLPRGHEKIRELTSRWRITSYPHLVLADAQGQPYAEQRGIPRDSSLETFLDMIEKLRQVRARRDSYLVRAAKASGADKLRWLDSALQTVPASFLADQEALIREVVRLDSNDHGAYRSRYQPQATVVSIREAQTLAGKRDWARVIAKVDEALEELAPAGTTVAGLLEARGNAHAEKEEYERAIGDFALAVELFPTNANLWYHLALAQVAAGRDEDYRRTCERMFAQLGRRTTTPPTSPTWLLQAAGLLPDAVSDTRRLEEMCRQLPSSYLNKRLAGRVLYRLGRFEAAVATLEEALRLADNLAERDRLFVTMDLAFLAASHQRLGHKTEAKQWLERAVRQGAERKAYLADNPALARTLDQWMNRVAERQYMAEFEALIGEVQDTKEMGEQLARARARARLGQWDEALKELDRLVERQPDEAGLQQERGRVLEHLGRSEAAQADFDRAVKMRAGEVARLRGAMQKAPSDRRGSEALSVALEGLARAQEQAGRPEEAAATLLQIQNLWPHDGARLYRVAEQIAALAIPKTQEKDSSAPESDRQRRVRDQAMAGLRRAVAAGYGQPGFLRRAREWLPFRSRGDFRDLEIELLVRQTFRAPSTELTRLKAHVADKALTSVDVSPDGRHAVSGSSDGSIRLWDLLKGGEPRFYDRFPGQAGAAAFSPDGRHVLIATTDGVVQLWNVETGRCTRWLVGHVGPVTAVRFLPDGRRALTGGEDGTLRLWDLEIGKELRRLGGDRVALRDLAVSPDGRRALAGGDDELVHLWDLESGRETAGLRGHQGKVWSVAISPDGRWGLSGGQDGLLLLWDLTLGQEVRRSVGNGHPVRGVAFAPDGRLALAVGEGLFLVWDVATGGQRHVPATANVTHIRVAFLPAGRHALTADSDGLVRLWDLSEESTRATYFARGGKWDRAAEACAELVRRYSRDGGAYMQLAALLGHRGQWKQAAAAFTEAAAFPEWVGRAEVWVSRGRCQAMLGAWDRAAGDFARALDLLGEGTQTVFSGELTAWDEVSSALGRLRPTDAVVGQALIDQASRRIAAFTAAGQWQKAEDFVKDHQARHADEPQTLLLAAALHRARAEAARNSGTAGTAAEREEEQVRALYEKLVARVPGNVAYAGELASVLLSAGHNWQVLRPVRARSAAGATLTRMLDGSVRASGKNPDRDTYTIIARTRMTGITALRLEALPDPSLPARGPGRHPTGNFHLSEAHLELLPDGIAGRAEPVRLVSAVADFEQAGSMAAGNAIDGNDQTHWGIHPRVGESHWIIFQTAAPVGGKDETTLRITLDFQERVHKEAILGRFRLLVTNRPLPSRPEQLALSQKNGWTRLGLAYLAHGDARAALAPLQKAAAAPTAAVPDHLHLARVCTQLGRAESARAAFARALDLLGSSNREEAHLRLAGEALSAAVQKWPEDLDLLTYRERLSSWQGRQAEAAADQRRIVALLDRRLKTNPHRAEDRRLHAELCAALGEWDRAADDLRKSLAAGKESRRGWYQTGWWVIGPYPEDLRTACPPETQTDPFRPVLEGGAAPRLWRPSGRGPGETLDLGALFNHAGHISAYAVARVYSPARRTVAILVGSDDGVRLWLNGKQIHDNPTYRPLIADQDVVPAVLEAGWNVLLARVNNGISFHSLAVRLSAEPADLSRAMCEAGWWPEDEALAREILAYQADQVPTLYAQAVHHRRRSEQLRKASVGPAPPAALAEERQARSFYERLLAVRPDSSSFARELAELLRSTVPEPAKGPKLDEATARALSRLQETGINDWAELGSAHLLRGEWAEALAALRKAAGRPGGGNGPEHLLLALVESRLGQASQAAQSFDRAFAWIAQHPAPEPLLQLAADYLSGALAKAADPAPLLARRAHVLGRLGRTGAAAADYGRLARREPKNSQWSTHRARLTPEVVTFWGFDQGPGGWHAFRDCRVSAAGGKLAVESAGGEPLVRVAVRSPRGWKKVVLHARAAAGAEAWLLWTTAARPGFSKEQAQRFALQGRPAEWADGVVYFKSDAEVTGLGLRPDNREGARLEIESVLLAAPAPEEVIAFLTREIEHRPGDARLWSDRAEQLAQLRRWKEAAADFARARELNPEDVESWYQEAVAHLARRDLEAYRRACAALLDYFATTDQPAVASKAAYICVSYPDAVADPEQVLALARLAVPLFRGNGRLLGAALYRAGKLDKAAGQLEETTHDASRAWDWLFLAMARHRLGDSKRARACFDHACRWIESAEREQSWIGWYERVEVEYLRQEAAALLGLESAQASVPPEGSPTSQPAGLPVSPAARACWRRESARPGIRVGEKGG